MFRYATRDPLKHMALASLLLASPAGAHEAWLLTPEEIETLASTPMPRLFADPLLVGSAAAVALMATTLALLAERFVAPYEARFAAMTQPLVPGLGLAALRLGLAAMLVLAAFGGLPRHGVAPWTQPTLLVPDMQLQLVPGTDWLITVQIALALVLAAGMYTRAAGLTLVVLSGLGLVLFGTAFLSYAPHFAGPGLILFALGGGRWSVDRLLGIPALVPMVAQVWCWHAARVSIGMGFVYLAVAYKLTQPTLLIAILEHGRFPHFGLGLPLVAVVMTWVEILCGALLVMGRLVRPVALALLGAITLLAVVLGETPLFHANLYGSIVVLLLAGTAVPRLDQAAGWRIA